MEDNIEIIDNIDNDSKNESKIIKPKSNHSSSNDLSFKNEFKNNFNNRFNTSKLGQAKQNSINKINAKKQALKDKIGINKNNKENDLNKKDSLTQKKDDLKSKKNSFIDKKNSLTNKKDELLDKINVKKTIKKKIILWIAPIVATILFYLLIIFVVLMMVIVPAIYLTNKIKLFDIFDTDTEEEIAEKKERQENFYSEISYDEMINKEFLNEEPQYDETKVDYVRGINSIYGGYNGGYSFLGDFDGQPYTSVSNAGPFTSWRQYDYRWANNRLGESSTLGKVGCLITSVAIQIARTGTKITPGEINGEFNPASFNNWLNNNNGYVGNLFAWRSVNKLTPNFIYQGQIALSGDYQSKYNSIINYYNMGYIIILELGKGEHWVAVTTVGGNKISMIDPASNSTNAGDRYYNLDYANWFAYYKVSD